MKICLVAINFIKHNGEGRVNYEIALKALAQGHNVTLIAHKFAEEIKQHPHATVIQLKSSKLPTTILKNFDFYRQTNAWLKKHGSKFDFIQVSGVSASFPADTYTVHFFHDTWLNSPFHPWQLKRNSYGLYQLIYGKLLARRQKKAYQQAKFLIAVSENLRQELIDYGFEPDKVKVINNGVDCQEFSGQNSTTNERKSLGLPSQVPLALFIGDVKLPRKNLDTVLRALTDVPQLHLAVVGRLRGSNYYPQLAVELGIGDRVQFLGFRQDVAAIMQSADFFVLPSRYDTFGMVVLEAMASGLPVVITQNMGVSSLVTRESGFTLPDTEDIPTLTAAMAELTHNPSLRKQMGAAGKAIAKANSWQVMANQYLELLPPPSPSDQSVVEIV
ncbi:Glycosyl transferase [Hyella patelloides LEGE 07179]|uniref:Glycosyl transferase n=1 Tax=Hyella patelloides LEGE 07179 TaxID=945734 RepID=A0A563VWV4_9CYAN|nr:glycosyltransferase family 4 protein [Hyella patelloides]VEP15938.1 Glycosyl transferase [Hyella patelloides LEGE 07179]